MSALGSAALHPGSPEVMNRILLRSSTPGMCRALQQLILDLNSVSSFKRKRLIILIHPWSLSHVLQVLLYLEGMQSDPPDPDDRDSVPPQSPRSQLTSPPRVSSPLMKGGNSGSARQGPQATRSGRSELSYVTDKRRNDVGGGDAKSARNDDFRSDIQEGRDSEVGASVPIRNGVHVNIHHLKMT
jgi:hypothetical protein